MWATENTHPEHSGPSWFTRPAHFTNPLSEGPCVAGPQDFLLLGSRSILPRLTLGVCSFPNVRSFGWKNQRKDLRVLTAFVSVVCGGEGVDGRSSTM